MSIYALLTGVLHKDAVSRVSQNGNEYVTCTVRVEQEGQTVWANVICFDALACAELLQLKAGDALSLQGKAMPKVYMKDQEARPSLQVTAAQVIGLAASPGKARPRYKPKAEARETARTGAVAGDADEGFDDPLPF